METNSERCARLWAELPKNAKGQPVLVIHTDRDLTPPGKRCVRLVRHAKGGKRIPWRLRWYVGGKIYHEVPHDRQGVDLSKQWIDAGEAK